METKFLYEHVLSIGYIKIKKKQLYDHLRHTFGLLPPIAPGLIEPVSWYRHRILETQPWDTLSCREMTHGRTPWWAISTILWRMWLGRGLPFMKTPPSWLTRPCPNGVETGQGALLLSRVLSVSKHLTSNISGGNFKVIYVNILKQARLHT